MNEKELNTALKDTFTVDVSRFTGHKSFEWALPLVWMNQVLSQCEYSIQPISGNCKLHFAVEENGIRVSGPLKFTGETECGTCLDKVLLDLCAHIDTFMQPAIDAEAEQDELTPEDLEIEYYSGNTISLDELIGDTILLELPMIPKCNVSCRKVKGLVTTEELERRKTTVDPRLSALADIQLSKES